MTVESIISVPVDDTSFKRFTAQFDKYQKELAKSSGMWKQAGTYQDAFGSKFAKVTSIMTGNAKVQKMLEDSTKRQLLTTTQSERLWTSISRSSGNFARNIGESAKSFLKISTVLEGIAGVLGLGGLWGLDRMASGIANSRRSAQGLGVSIGQEKAFNINYGKLVDSGSFLNWINSMEGDISKQGAAYSLTGRGLSGNTGNDAVSLLDSIRGMSKTMPLNQLMPVLNAYGVKMSMDELRRLREGSDSEYAGMRSGYNKMSRELNVPDADAKKWQDFVTKMQETASGLLTVIQHSLLPLEGPLEKLSDGFKNFIETLAKSHVVEDAIEGLAKWLESFSGAISAPKFLDSVKAFTSDVGDLAQAIHGIAHPGETIGSAAASAGVGLKGWLNDTGWKEQQLDKAAQANVFKLAAGYGAAYGLPKGLLEAEAWNESRGNVNIADSAKGAMGVMQLMPGTAKQYGINPRDPGQAIRGGAMLDQDLVRKYQGDIAKVLAAYNWGQGNLDKDIAAHGANWLQYAPQETRNYVKSGQVAITIFNNTGGSAATAVSTLGAM